MHIFILSLRFICRKVVPLQPRTKRKEYRMQRQNKKTRLQVIRMIVSSQALESQEELQVEMDKAGFPCTQTTLSRDLKQLRISKVRSRGGRNVYALPREGQFQPVPTHEEIKQSRWSLGENGSLMVIHTPPGHASMVAYDLDALRSPLLLGTIAGDDTILVVLAPEAEPADVRALIRETVPGLKLKG